MEDAHSSASYFRDVSWVRVSSVAALGLALSVLLLRFSFASGTSLTYDEATYVELAGHPWTSSYYPDDLFVRHPPLFFLLMATWVPLAGSSEMLLRLPALVFTAWAVGLAWDAARRRGGGQAATLVGVLLSTSFLLLVYGIQATMYPLAAFFASLALWGHVRGRDRVESLAVVGLALTHLFGFLFLALWVYRRRRESLGRDLAYAAPATAWLATAAVSVLFVNDASEGELGPIWQAVRAFELVAALVADQAAALRHAWVYVLTVLLLNPVLLMGTWEDRTVWWPWTWGAMVLTAAFLPGPPFMRLALVVLPVTLVVGAAWAASPPRFRRMSALALLLSLSSLTAGTAYVNAGLDPNAGNDVPGLEDWRSASAAVAEGGITAVVSPATPPVAYYLEVGHGMRVGEASTGPDAIRMTDGNRSILIRRAVTGDEFIEHGRDENALLLVPQTWTGVQADLFEAGFVVCGRVEGVVMFSATQDGCPRL